METATIQLDDILSELRDEVMARPDDGPVIIARDSNAIKKAIENMSPEHLFKQTKQFFAQQRPRVGQEEPDESEEIIDSRVRMIFSVLLVRFFEKKCRRLNFPRLFSLKDWDYWFDGYIELPKRK